MEKIKKFWRKNKVKICVIGGVVVAGTITLLLTKDSKNNLITERKNLIMWGDMDLGTMGIEKVKAILESNKDNDSKFAIYREGPNPNDYITIMLDNKVVIPWLEN